MIGTIALAQRIEAAEARLSLAMADVVRRGGRDDAFGLVVGSGAAVYCGPGEPMTKVIGVGVSEPLTDVDIDRIEAAYASTGVFPGFEMATLGDFDSIRRLERRGYVLQRIEMAHGRDLTRPTLIDPPSGGLRVERGHDELWARLSVGGFAAPDTVDGRDAPAEHYDTSVLERVVQQFAGVDSVRRYVAFLDDVPAGAGSARVDGTLFQMCGASTLPEHRRRGVQSALLAARLADARAAGCDLAVVTVEPGSPSQANVVRRLFAPLYSRLVLARES
ncbi:MAG TPA: GNAT family N-acetyltransferase [Luteitalea sp.]|nr:GNAT family N-acetyltransferase [Luteitalea sp.]